MTISTSSAPLAIASRVSIDFTVGVVAGYGIEKLLDFIVNWVRMKNVTVNVGGVDITGNEKDIANIVKELQSEDDDD